ncbi:MAG: uracil phosphoribosyltransferase [Cyanobacteria bacterium QS_7_48_42]|jgi:uracil phosphoribosyltransferase|nr:MAG: uracil phosphoribosyltransferase [Cyanobacteria bacterium QH_1_48_107]PSO56579.1 MAG: uracil phosphoribosyltransferase [Cyanobacteria bacterium QH_10_48_56]PSO58159.1 MAG: uracil phosphoribosyltransferase [Cyanobacteria bacterium QH_7_48_89]PSO62329.1 MAG: uracil phosphoribosyltransferase [Cyanobacteria bacterium QH_2_48_84]PSO65467.1 MAG: uracil phosphoribosyltransferase [Cyanobacteria bacterium QH_6_48_35]PSO66982.1 MAG: uracil phosphoribosyltransferase [Cyanobacteria bacterium QS_1_
MSLQLRVYVPDHPLIKHWLSVARDVNTPSVLFKSAMTELGRWLTYEASRYWLPTGETSVQTPLDTSAATMIDPEVPIAVVPILRAGLALLDGAQTLLPLASIYHLGLVRDEQTLEASCYLNKLPEQFDPQTRVVILEPMLATGGSIMFAMEELTRRGIDPASVRIVSVVAAPPALQKLNEKFPGLNVYTAIIDEQLDSQGVIVPGLGDAGDRAFGT